MNFKQLSSKTGAFWIIECRIGSSFVYESLLYTLSTKSYYQNNKKATLSEKKRQNSLRDGDWKSRENTIVVARIC